MTPPFKRTDIAAAVVESIGVPWTPTLETRFNEHGQPVRWWIYQGAVCRVETIDSRSAKSLAGFGLIRSDLLDCQSWLQTAQEVLDSTTDIKGVTRASDTMTNIHLSDPRKAALVKALWFAAVTSYGKCFTSSEGRSAQLDEQWVPQALLSKHVEIMNYRHTLTAHSGRSGQPMAEYAQTVLVHPPYGIHGPAQVKIQSTRLDMIDDRDDRASFLGLVQALLSKVEAKQRTLESRLMRQILAERSQAT